MVYVFNWYFLEWLIGSDYNLQIKTGYNVNKTTDIIKEGLKGEGCSLFYFSCLIVVFFREKLCKLRCF